METMAYDSRNRDHKLIADDLGLLLKMIDNGNVYKDEHSYYAGAELATQGEPRPPGHEYRKKDVAGSGNGFRTKNRVIVPVDRTSKKPMEGMGYFWRHDERIFKLDAQFFIAAQLYRHC
jgi:hypothetical protein